MAKNPKKSKETEAPESPSPAPSMESSNGHGIARPKAPVAAKKRAAKPAAQTKKSAGKGRGTAVGKSTATRKTRGKKAEGAAEPAVTDEQIRLRAYFISEWRLKNGMPGDSANDWLEARRQLQAEADQS